MTKYIPLYRPASFATLPRSLAWTYVEVPSYITTRPDLPTSEHTHGVIECRELTKEELAEFELRPAKQRWYLRQHASHVSQRNCSAGWEHDTAQDARDYVQHQFAKQKPQDIDHTPFRFQVASSGTTISGYITTAHVAIESTTYVIPEGTPSEEVNIRERKRLVSPSDSYWLVPGSEW